MFSSFRCQNASNEEFDTLSIAASVAFEDGGGGGLSFKAKPNVSYLTEWKLRRGVSVN